MDFKQKFVIDECPNAPGRWYVDWTQLGPIEKDIAKYKLCEIVFDHIRPFEIGIGYNVEYYRPKNKDFLYPKTTPPGQKIIPREVFEVVEDTRWEVLWISCTGWQQLQEYQYEMFAEHLFRSRTPKHTATGIIFHTLDQAEQFVNLMEQQFTFHILKRTYATDW